MKTMEMSILYAGTTIEATINPEEICAGTVYPVETEGAYLFTLLEDEDGEWSIMREKDGITPMVEKELYDAILKEIRYQLRYAA